MAQIGEEVRQRDKEVPGGGSLGGGPTLAKILAGTRRLISSETPFDELSDFLGDISLVELRSAFLGDRSFVGPWSDFLGEVLALLRNSNVDWLVGNFLGEVAEESEASDPVVSESIILLFIIECTERLSLDLALCELETDLSDETPASASSSSNLGSAVLRSSASCLTFLETLRPAFSRSSKLASSANSP